MLLVTFSHGKESITPLLPGVHSEDNSNVSTTADHQERPTTATNENHLSKERKLIDLGKAEYSRLLARLASSPSPLPLSLAETPAVEPEATAEAWPEPGPDWSKAFGEWGVAWEFHVYVFAVIFLGFAVYASYFIGHGLYVGLHQKYLGFCLNIVMLILGFTRAFVLFTDPYHQGNIIHNLTGIHIGAMRVLWSLASPCLTSADCLVILALLETAKISLVPPKMQKFSVILKIIIMHFTFVLTSDFVVSYVVEAKAMLVFCQVFFISWGSLLGVGYFALGYKLDKKLFSHKEVKSKKELLYIRLIYASGVNNFILCAMFIYSSVGVFGVYSDVEFVDAWSWWAIQTCFRASEVLSGILVFTVSAKRKSLKRSTDHAATGEIDNFTELPSTSAGPPDPTKKTVQTQKERRISMFTHFYSKRDQQNTATVEILPDLQSDSDDSEHNLFTDLNEAKIEAYHACAHEDAV